MSTWMLLAALAAEGEADGGALDLGVAVAQGGQAEGVVGARVLLVADADERGLQQPHHRGQHLLARQPLAAEVAPRPAGAAPAAPRRRRSCGRTWSRRGRRASGVVAVLLAAAGVAAGGLEVAVRRAGRSRRRSRPAGWRASRSAAARRGRARGAVRQEVGEALAAPPAADAGSAVADVAQARGAGAGGRIGGGRRALHGAGPGARVVPEPRLGTALAYLVPTPMQSAASSPSPTSRSVDVNISRVGGSSP